MLEVRITVISGKGEEVLLKSRAGNILCIDWVVITNANIHQAVYLELLALNCISLNEKIKKKAEKPF